MDNTNEQNNVYSNPQSQPQQAPQQAPQYSEQQYAQPQQAPQYAQPQYAQPQQAPQYTQPQYAQPQYGQPQYAQQTQYSSLTNNTGVYGPTSSKSKLAAGLLGIFLGVFGVHNFYLGHTGKAVGQLLITILSFGMLWFVSSIWGLIEGILILCSKPGTKWHKDSDGAELQD